MTLTVPLPLAGITLAACFLAGCTSPAAPTSSTPAGAANAPAAKPKLTRLVVGTTAPAFETNEVRHVNQRDQWQTAPMYERLFANDENTGKRVGQLLSDWKLEPDGLSYRFLLRKDVKLHYDKGTLSSADVVESFRDHMQDDSLRGSAPNLRATVKAVEPVDDTTLIMRLQRPAAEFLYASGQADIISGKHLKEQGAATLQSPNAGTGPYIIKERTQGSFVRFERVGYTHWRLQPDFPELEVRFLKEPSTRLAALLAGEVHMTDLPEDLQKQATTNPAMKVIGAKASGQRVWVEFYGPVYKDPKNPNGGLAHTEGPMADVRVRTALSKAIDRKKLNEAFIGGKGLPMVNTHFSSNNLGWDPTWEKRFDAEYAFDQAKARALLAEAGYGPGKPAQIGMLMIDVEGLASGRDLAEAVAQNWRSVGVEVKLEQMDTNTFNQLMRTGRLENQARIRTSGTDIYNALTNINDGFRETRTVGISLMAADQAYADARNTLDEAKQDEHLRRAGNVWFDGHHNAPLYWLPQEVVANGTYVGEYPFPGNVTGGWTHLEYITAAK